MYLNLLIISGFPQNTLSDLKGPKENYKARNDAKEIKLNYSDPFPHLHIYPTIINAYICCSPDRNLGRSWICLGQIGILFWPGQILDLPKVSLGKIRIPIWLGRFRAWVAQAGRFVRFVHPMQRSVPKSAFKMVASIDSTFRNAGTNRSWAETVIERNSSGPKMTSYQQIASNTINLNFSSVSYAI